CLYAHLHLLRIFFLLVRRPRCSALFPYTTLFRSRYFPPETGGLVPQGAPLVAGVFRIDHDQAFQSTLNLRYQRPRNAEWVALTYRYDSGLVVSGVPDSDFALSILSNAQQTSIGLSCGSLVATVE